MNGTFDIRLLKITIQEYNLLLKWLKGNPVEIDGKVYVFPHGTSLIRKMIDKK